MMTHHDERGYAVAASAAAKVARTKFEKMLETGEGRAQSIIERVLNEVPTDRIVKAPALAFNVEGGQIRVRTPDGADLAAVPNATHQLAEKADIPRSYVDTLLETGETDEEHAAAALDPWRARLLAHNLAEQYRNRKTEKYLLRSYTSELRGFLSDKFRRLDSRPLLDAFARASQDVGAVLLDGLGSSVKTLVRVALPIMFEPIDNEVMLVGLTWQNSDYGAGAHEIKMWVLRTWCTNLATLESALRQVHLGKRLDDNIDFSQKTYNLDTATTASAIGDVVKGLLAPDRVNAVMDEVKRLGGEQIDTAKVLADIAAKTSKKFGRELAETFNTPDVELLPPGNTAWRMSNALSLLAQKQTDLDKRLELEKLAGSFFQKAA